MIINNIATYCGEHGGIALGTALMVNTTLITLSLNGHNQNAKKQKQIPECFA